VESDLRCGRSARLTPRSLGEKLDVDPMSLAAELPMRQLLALIGQVGEAFVQVVAVDRTSGEQVLLLYENVAQRAHPIQIIRFRSQPGVEANRR